MTGPCTVAIRDEGGAGKQRGREELVVSEALWRKMSEYINERRQKMKIT